MYNNNNLLLKYKYYYFNIPENEKIYNKVKYDSYFLCFSQLLSINKLLTDYKLMSESISTLAINKLMKENDNINKYITFIQETNKHNKEFSSVLHKNKYNFYKLKLNREINKNKTYLNYYKTKYILDEYINKYYYSNNIIYDSLNMLEFSTIVNCIEDNFEYNNKLACVASEIDNFSELLYKDIKEYYKAINDLNL